MTFKPTVLCPQSIVQSFRRLSQQPEVSKTVLITNTDTCLTSIAAMRRLQSATAGNYLVSVTNSVGEGTAGSPFTIQVQPSTASAAHSYVKMLNSSAILAGGQFKLQLAAQDVYGNEVMLVQGHMLCFVFMIEASFHAVSCSDTVVQLATYLNSDVQ